MTQPSSNATALVTPDGVQCRGQVVLSKTWLPNDELRILRQQLDDCGFLYIAPSNTVDAEWLAEAHTRVQDVWINATKNHKFKQRYAEPVNAGGKRVDLVLPPRGPFKNPFNKISPSIFQLLNAAIDDCCELQMMIAVNAMRLDDDSWGSSVHTEEQEWHDDSMPGLGSQQIDVAIALHDIESGLVAVQPGCFPPKGFHYQTSDDDADVRQECYSSAGYAPERLAAGGIIMHRSSLRHRGLWNYGSTNRFMLHMYVCPTTGDWQFQFAGTTHGNGRWGEIQGKHGERFAKRLHKALGRKEEL